MTFNDLLVINNLVFGENVSPMVQIVRDSNYSLLNEHNLENAFIYTGRRSLMLLYSSSADEYLYIPFDDYYCLKDIELAGFDVIVEVTNQYSLLGRGTDIGSEFVLGQEISQQQEPQWVNTFSYFPSVKTADKFHDMSTFQSYFIIRYPSTKVLK